MGSFMRFIRELPILVAALGATAVLTIAAVIIWAVLAPPQHTSQFQFTKDIALPLVGPIVSILTSTILFYLIPRKLSKQNAPLELFKIYYQKDFMEDRVRAWDYYVETEQQVINKRLEEFVRFSSDPQTHGHESRASTNAKTGTSLKLFCDG